MYNRPISEYEYCFCYGEGNYKEIIKEEYKDSDKYFIEENQFCCNCGEDKRTIIITKANDDLYMQGFDKYIRINNEFKEII